MIKKKNAIVFVLGGLFLMLCLSFVVPRHMAPVILVGNKFFSKDLFYQTSFARIESLANFDEKSGEEIAVFGGWDTGEEVWDFGAEIVNAETKVLKSKIEFQPKQGMFSSTVVNAGKGGGLEFMSTGGGYSEVGLFDSSGKVLWIYHPDSGNPPDGLVAGDLNGDGITEFYASTHHGLDQLNHKGERIWRRGDWAMGATIFHQREGKQSLVSTLIFGLGPKSRTNKFQFRNFSGELVKEFYTQEDMHNLIYCEWPDSGHILTFSDKSLYVYDFNGNLIFKYKPWNLEIYDINCCTVRFESDRPPYLVTVVKSSSGTHRSMLSIFSHEGKLVYQEVLGENTTALSKTWFKSSKNEVLMVGVDNAVWKYCLRQNK